MSTPLITTLAASFLDTLTGVSRVSWSDPRASIGWKHELPAWAWLLLAVACLGLAALTYHRLLGPRWARIGLGSLRAVTLLVILALLAGPMLVVANEEIDPDWLIMLVDRSASMRVHDMAPLNAASSTIDRSALISRYGAVRQSLVTNQALFSDPKLALNRKIVWMGFDSGTYDIDPPYSPAAPQGDPEGQSTAIRTALEEALQRAGSHPISGIVLITDGRSDQPTGSDLVHRLQQQAVSVFPVPIGDPHAGLDLSIGEVEYPDKAFVKDTIPVNVSLERYPPDAPVDPSRIHVQLIDTVSNKILDEQSPRDATLRDPIHLSTQSDAAGPVRWRIKVLYDVVAPTASQPATSPATAPDASGSATDNTIRDVRMELVDRPIGVLYIEGYPRWEYRYLKNMLVREKSVSSSMMLISADRSFPQEGSNPITRLPRNAEELKPYDVIIIGDVPSNYFSTDQLAMFRDHVSHRGAGLLWIGGEAATPNSYDGTALSALLPMRSPGAVVRSDRAVGAVLMKPTALADALGVLHLKTSGKSDEAARTGGSRGIGAFWPERLSPLQWTQSLGDLKPSAESLAVVADQPGKPVPLLLRMRFGAGQTLYLATDETWRWRFGRGELYFERFWIQLVRMLARNRLQDAGQRAVLSLSSRRVTVGEPTVVQLKVTDQSLLDREMPKLSVGVYRVDAQGKPQNTPIERLELLRQAAESGDTGGSTADAQYRALWRPSAPGKLVLRVNEPSLDDLGITRDTEAVLANDEIRNPAPDPDRLVALAKDTGGKVLKLDQFDQLPKLLPNRAKRTPSDISEPLWNSYLALILVMLLLTVEWIGRKMIRLV